MRLLGIDYGQKRTGLALSDPEGRMAFPLCTVAMETRNSIIEAMEQLVEQHSVQGIVIGLPLGLDGQETLSTRQVRNFAERVKRRVSIPVYFMDERLSSYTAEQQLQAIGKKRKSLQKILDQAAAVVILESFLAQTQSQRMQA